jgi:hypothetical protein
LFLCSSPALAFLTNVIQKVCNFLASRLRAGFLAVGPGCASLPEKEKRGETAATKHLVA